MLEEARRLSALGFNTLPTRRGKKAPAFPWKQYQKERVAHMVEEWWSPSSNFVGIFTACGSISNLLVLDCDSPEAERLWRAQIGPEMDATTCVKTSKGHHYWFALAPKQIVRSWAYHETVEGVSISFDVKAEGGGVMTPPSPHPDGGYYAWIREPECLQAAPTLLLGGLGGMTTLLSGESGAAGQIGADPVEFEASPTSLLDHLLNNAPAEGGRNEWMIRIAGHYAKMIPFADAVRTLCRQANQLLTPPLSDAEVVKTADSAWRMERSKGFDTVAALQERGIVAVDTEPHDSNGWLVGASNVILCPALIKDADDKKAETMLPWCDFNIQVVGIVDNGESTDYLVRLLTQHGEIECVLKGTVLGRTNDLIVWLAERRATVVPPDGDMHKRAGVSARLTRYVKSQPAKSYRLTNTLGWDENTGTFITHDGLIRASSVETSPFEDVRPSLDLKTTGWAPYRYGFTGTREDAQGVLREVMTFHDETVTAVYGAWWAATFLKTQMMQRAALFPFMALEAPSGSGKSTGFFAAMVQMSGNTEGHGQYTAPSLRDRAATHNAGLVWIDDVTDLSDVLDLIRQATSGGSRSKKSGNRHDIETVRLVSPIALSGEGIAGLAEEKALGDRAVRLDVPTPDQRRSLRDPDKSQWEDVTALQMQWRGDFTQLAGWYVSMALECVPLIEEWSSLRPDAAVARFADTMTIIRVGARVLAHMMGSDDNDVVARVDVWVAAQIDTYDPNANLLTNTILPWVFRDLNYPTTSNSGVAVFVDDKGAVWYREEKVSDVWNARNHITERARQLSTLDALRAQRARLGDCGEGVAKRIGRTNDGPRARYHVLPPSASRAVIRFSGYEPSPKKARSTFELDGDDDA